MQFYQMSHKRLSYAPSVDNIATGISSSLCLLLTTVSCIPYSGNVWQPRGGKFGESSVIRQTKTIQTFALNYIQSSCVTHLVYYTPIHCCSLLYSSKVRFDDTAPTGKKIDQLNGPNPDVW